MAHLVSNLYGFDHRPPRTGDHCMVVQFDRAVATFVKMTVLSEIKYSAERGTIWNTDDKWLLVFEPEIEPEHTGNIFVEHTGATVQLEAIKQLATFLAKANRRLIQQIASKPFVIRDSNGCDFCTLNIERDTTGWTAWAQCGNLDDFFEGETKGTATAALMDLSEKIGL